MSNPTHLPGCLSCLQSLVKPNFYSFPFALLSDGFISTRNRCLVACIVELCFAACSLPLGAVRGGISKISTGLNLILIFASLWGVVGSVRLSGLMVALHAMLVFGLLFLFLAYIALVVAFAKGDQTDEGEWVLVAVFAFCLVDVIVAFFTSCFAWSIRKEYVRLSKMSAADIARAAGATGVTGGTPVAAAAAAAGRGSGSRASSGGAATVSVAMSPTGATAAATARAAALTDGKGRTGDSSTECVVCLTGPRDCVLYRCGHNVLCMPCGRNLKARNRKCPICRANIEDVVQKFG